MTKNAMRFIEAPLKARSEARGVAFYEQLRLGSKPGLLTGANLVVKMSARSR
jgi:hypothetical protein